MLQIIYKNETKKAIFFKSNTLYKCRENEREKKMGIACFQLNIWALNQTKTVKSRKAMQISDKRDMVTTRLAKRMQEVGGEWFKDPDVKMLQNDENDLDNELKLIETVIKDIDEKLVKYEKQKEDNIKKEVPSLSL